MKRIFKILMVFVLLTANAAAGTGRSLTQRKISLPEGLKGKSADTAWVNYYVRKGLSHLSKKLYNTEKVRAYIDTASLICEKNDIDYTANLHFLKAEYFYETGDFSKSETEATLAKPNQMKIICLRQSLCYSSGGIITAQDSSRKALITLIRA